MSQKKNKQLVEAGKSSKVRIVWSKDLVHEYCDICIEAVNKGYRPTQYFNKAGWKYVVEEFAKRTGEQYDRGKLKNKWDVMKADWKHSTGLLKKETGLRWNSLLGTVEAEEEWWAARIQEYPSIEKFRKKGFGLDLVDKWDIMFNPTPNVGQHVEEKGEPPQPKRKKKKSTDEPPQPKKKKEKSTKGKGKSVADEEDDSTESSASVNNYGHSHVRILLTELGGLLKSINGLREDPDLLIWALKFLMDHEHMAVFQGIKSDDMRYGWLKYMYEREKQCKIKLVHSDSDSSDLDSSDFD